MERTIIDHCVTCFAIGQTRVSLPEQLTRGDQHVTRKLGFQTSANEEKNCNKVGNLCYGQILWQAQFTKVAISHVRIRTQTPSTGLRYPSFKEGAGKRCWECDTHHKITIRNSLWSCCSWEAHRRMAAHTAWGESFCSRSSITCGPYWEMNALHWGFSMLGKWLHTCFTAAMICCWKTELEDKS